MEYNEKVLEFANKIARTKKGSKSEIKPEYPEYKILEPGVTEEMAEVGLSLRFRERLSVEEVAKECNKPVEKTAELLWALAEYGAAFMNNVDGVDKYWLDLWVPGHFEMIVNNKENIKKYPAVGKAFNDYGLRRAPMSAGNFPVGSGVMRVIPIERAIEGETHRASYEEVSKYLNENTIFSVSDCSCRTSREAMGEGCGHLKEDMCIQMGHAADYYIRTGRGREITREEAFEIIERAEENGLMHNMPNTDGHGKTHAICNCCGCSCFAVRNAAMYKNTDFVKSNYTAKVDPEKCVACGECVAVCPVNALKLGRKICNQDALTAEKPEFLPSNTNWTEEHWNKDYRTNRENVVEEGTSPCKTNCPAHISVQGYIKLASQGRYTEALELIKHENPFPAVCGRICPRYCESDCTRSNIDDPVAVDDIKKFIAEQDLKQEHRYIPKKRHDYGKKIAVVGAGPSGLSCAYYLAIDGYAVTVFEKEELLGGMLTLGIPSYRLEKDVVYAEIDVLKTLGVEFKTGIEVGKDISLDQLRKDGFEGFYLAIGAQGGRSLGIEGEESEGVMTGVEFLRNVNLGKPQELGGKTVVIGGGNVAIDVARTAVRINDESVELYCLENAEEMPALQEERDEAVAEGITINNSWGPTRILQESGRVVGVEFKKCLSVFDENKKFSPKFDESTVKVVPADNVLISIGQTIEWGDLLEGTKAVVNPNGTVQIDPETLQTGEPDIFAGGDVTTGPYFAIDAIALGKEGAISLHRFVQPGQSLVIGRDRRAYKAFDKEALELNGFDSIPRQQTSHVAGDIAKRSFNDLRSTFSEEQVRLETERCLGCGATTTDEYMCIGCGACTLRCKFDAITLHRVHDAGAVEVEDLKKVVVKHALKRKGRIAVTNLKRKILKKQPKA